MDYVQLKSIINSNNPGLLREMLTFELNQIGFESFTETSDGLIAYCPKNIFEESMLNAINFHQHLDLGSINFSWEIIPEQNWNSEWEKNFSPVLIANKCYIRAPFHNSMPEAAYEIIIEPKMSFGTGHHETTSLMIQQMFSIDFAGKEVLDMGSGTGILAILASKLKAKSVLAIDIEEWAYQNSIENKMMNDAQNISIKLGDVQLIKDKTFDIVLANINRNILLADISSYAKSLIPEGILLVSGIYTFDKEMIKGCAESNHLIFENFIEQNDWISIRFRKLK